MQEKETKVVVSYDDETIIEKRDLNEKTIETIIANIKIAQTLEIDEDSEELVSLDITITIDSEMFTLLKAHYDAESFEQLKEEKELRIEFAEFPSEIIHLLKSSQEKHKKKDAKKHDFRDDDADVESAVYFMVEADQCSLCFFDVLSFKEVEIFRIPFKQAGQDESHLQAQNAFSAVKKELLIETKKLKILNNEIKKQCPFMFEYIKKP